MLASQRSSAIELLNINVELAAVDQMSQSFSLIYTVAALSTLGCVFNMAVTIYLKLYRHVIGKMVLNLCISDLLFIWSFVAMLKSYGDINQTISDIIEALYLLSSIGSTVWVCCFAHMFYFLVVPFENSLTKNLIYKRYLITISLLIIGFGLGLLTLDVFANLSAQESALIYGILTAILLSTSIIYCLTYYIIALRNMRRNEVHTHLVLLLYPLILVFCEIPSLSMAIAYFLDYRFSKLFKEIAFGLLLSRGFWNALAYGLSQKVRKIFIKCCANKNAEGYLAHMSLQNMKQPINQFFTPNSSILSNENISSENTMDMWSHLQT